VIHSEIQDDEDFVIESVESSVGTKSKPWIVPVVVNKTIIPVKLDTGSDVNILSHKDFIKLKVKSSLHDCQIKVTAYDGSEIPVKGRAILSLSVNGHTYKTAFVICTGDVVPILGRRSCDKIGLVKRVF
jgi:hypothetical protein